MVSDGNEPLLRPLIAQGLATPENKGLFSEILNLSINDGVVTIKSVTDYALCAHGQVSRWRYGHSAPPKVSRVAIIEFILESLNNKK